LSGIRVRNKKEQPSRSVHDLAVSAAKTSFRAAVKNYQIAQKNDLDRHARDLLARLARDRLACDAIKQLQLDEIATARFLETCVQAEQAHRTFGERIKLEQEMLADGLQRLRQCAAKLTNFVEQITKPPAETDRLSSEIVCSVHQRALLKHAFAIINDLIEAREHVARGTLLRLGFTRDHYIAKAAENAAIGTLAQGVRLITGKAHQPEIAKLVKIILGIDIGRERIRHAEHIVSRWRFEPNEPKLSAEDRSLLISMREAKETPEAIAQ
jgi:hypothetical protein